jgi:hypothetical protein
MRKKRGSEITARRIPESRTASVTIEAKLQFNTRIDDRVARKQLQPTEMTSDRIIMKPIKTKTTKLIAGLQKVEDWTFW